MVEKREYAGSLIELSFEGKGNHEVRLNGFWRHESKRSPVLLVFVHGMYSNFYSSRLKKEVLKRCVKAGYDCFSFNNRGAEESVRYEKFEDCLRDIDVVLEWAKNKGYRRFILMGHSTGCQKITYWQARRKDSRVMGIVLLAPGDDYAIARRDAGAQFGRLVSRARRLVEQGKGDELMPPNCMCFSARRYLSIADPGNTEAKIFDYSGRLYHFRQVTCPVLLLFGSEEQYACLPVEEMHEILRSKTRSEAFTDYIVPGGDHSFHDCEWRAVQKLLRWADSLFRKSPK